MHLYVSRKNVLTWLMALCLVGSAVARIVITGVKGIDYTQHMWSQIVLPVAATLLYVAILLWGGKESFYKTAIPVGLMALYYAIRPHSQFSSPWTLGLYISFLVFFTVLYFIISSGRLRCSLFFLFLFPAAIIGCMYGGIAGPLSKQDFWAMLPDAILFGSCLILSLTIHVSNDNAYHRTWGDRPDGRRLRSLPAITLVGAYLMPERNTCDIHFEESIEISHIERYIRQKRREGLTDFGMNHVLMAAYCRGIAKYPQLNRFISGQKIFSRDQDIVYCMTVKKDMSIDSEDTTIKVHLTPYDTADDVYRKMKAAVVQAKEEAENPSGVDGLASALTLVPGLLLKFVVWLLKLLDYFGLVPKALLEVSPLHGSLYFTSMGSLGIRPVYHHLYNFGNIPIFGAMGCKRRVTEVQEDGTLVQKKYVDVKFVVDERIVDGFYYATFIKHYRWILRNPELLDQPPEKVLKDVD